MKKLIALILTGVSILYSFGFVVIFYQQKLQNHMEICKAENLSADDKGLTVFSFTKSELQNSFFIHWLDKNEFSINDDHYDVVKKVSTGDSVTLYCVHDEKEEVLLNGLYSLLSQNQDKKYPGGKMVIHLLNNLLLCGISGNSFSWKPELKCAPVVPKRDNVNYSYLFEIPSPPPKS